MQLRKLYLSLITSGILLSVSNSAFSDSTIKDNKSVENNEHSSLSAPTADSPHDIKEQKNANDRNLSSPPPHNPTTNNKPFDGNDNKNNKSSSSDKKAH